MGRPLNKIVEVKPAAQQMEKAGFIVSTDRTQYMPEKGVVLAIGKEVDDVKVGDEILFRKGAYSKVNIKGEDVLLLEEKNIYYIL